MTYITASVAITRIFARFEQALNMASLQELAAYGDMLQGGASMTDLLTAQWQAGHPMSVSRSDQNHVLRHAFDGGDQGWWGPDAAAIATEGLAQGLQRMLFSPTDAPRTWPKRVQCLWVVAGTHHFHVAVTESAQQVTMLWMTPPKGDQIQEYKLYLETKAAAERLLERPRDRSSRVPRNLTRLENIWTVCAKRWALLEGIDESGKPRKVAVVQRTLTKAQGIVVTRALCEDYQDRHPQSRGRGGRAKAR